MKLGVLDSILAARSSGVACALITELESGQQRLLQLSDTGLQDWKSSTPTSEAAPLDAEVETIVRDAIVRDRSGIHNISDKRTFVQVFNRPLRMIVVGAVHIAQALVPIALTTGFKVTVVDPRTAFASELRFPGTQLNHEWPDDALEGLDLDHRCAVITLSHDPKIDDPALEVALRSDVFYIGSLGSRRTHATRLDRLRQRGFEETALSRIHAPVGLNIHAQSTAEIAVAVVAQTIQELRKN
jgi:xanthine dehydrogenase accessory factor